ncbi:hypothetical protein DFS34DRAFT_691312 [Phlyctochytrium arcticum]|nr:hypothetical protein DFS34DRAFT_691312 [Phlyctochytrium arcticum]
MDAPTTNNNSENSIGPSQQNATTRALKCRALIISERQRLQAERRKEAHLLLVKSFAPNMYEAWRSGNPYIPPRRTMNPLPPVPISTNPVSQVSSPETSISGSSATHAGSASDPVLPIPNSIISVTQGSLPATSHFSDDNEVDGDHGAVSPADTQSYPEQLTGGTENDAMDLTPMSSPDEGPSIIAQDRQSGTPRSDPQSTEVHQPATSNHSQRRNDCDSTDSESTTVASKQDMNQVTRDAANQSSQFPHHVPTTEEFSSSGSGSHNAVLPPTGRNQPDGSVVPQNPITPVDKIISTSEREKIFARRIRTPAPRFPVMETSPSFTAPKARRNLTGTWLPHEPLSSATVAGSASDPVLPAPNLINPATQGSSPATKHSRDDSEDNGDYGSVSPVNTQSCPEQTFGGAEGDAMDLTPVSSSNEGPSTFAQDRQSGTLGCDTKLSASKQPTASRRSQKRKRSDGDSEGSESILGPSPKRRRIDQDRNISEIARAHFISANDHEETPTSIVTSGSSFANTHEKGKNSLTPLDLNSIKPATEVSSSGRNNAGGAKENHGDYRFVSPVGIDLKILANPVKKSSAPKEHNMRIVTDEISNHHRPALYEQDPTISFLTRKIQLLEEENAKLLSISDKEEKHRVNHANLRCQELESDNQNLKMQISSRDMEITSLLEQNEILRRQNARLIAGN